MNPTTKFSNGWTIAASSFKVLKGAKRLFIFPILSGLSIIGILAFFCVAFLGFSNWRLDQIPDAGRSISYTILVFFYLTNYFVIEFFNMALVHCTSLYFRGEAVTVQKGIDFSMSQFETILAGAVLAGTLVGILKVFHENVKSFGKIITSLLDVAWSIRTFFIVPVIAFENLGPTDAFKKSAALIKENWGERVRANFSFGLIHLGGLMSIAVVVFAVSLINLLVGIIAGVLLLLLMSVIMTTIKTIFTSVIYHNLNGEMINLYSQPFIDNLFQAKRN